MSVARARNADFAPPPSRLRKPAPGAIPRTKPGADQRRFPRHDASARKLQLLIDGAPTSFAIHNISEGGVMGDNVGDLQPGAQVSVRFDGETVVPAIVKWTKDGHIGLAFTGPGSAR